MRIDRDDPRHTAPPGITYEIAEPAMWGRDDGKRREPVLDHSVSPPRVVRYVGWRKCLKCRTDFFSADVRGLRMCEYCRKSTSDSHDW